MKTAAVYIRVSTEEQTEYSPEAQLKAAREYAARNDMILHPDHVYIDEGISGKGTKNRTAFNRMIGAAKTKPKPFDVILLWKFSRFARNREDSIVYKSLLRRQLGIEVISITENIGDDKLSILLEALIEAMDEYYSINLAEEVKKGMTEKAVRGEYQTSPPLGYCKLPGQPLKIVEEEARFIRYIFQQYLSGESFFAIAKCLNTMGFRTKRGNQIENRTVEYILNNPVYKGYARWSPSGKILGRRIYDSKDTITVKSDHEPIISETVFDQARERLAAEKRRKKPGARPSEAKKHYLSGLLKCGSCGSTLSYSQSTQGFQCISYSHGRCSTSHFIKASLLESALFQELDRLFPPDCYVENHPGVHTHASSDGDDSVEPGREAALAREISSLEKALSRASQAYLSGIDTAEEYKKNKRHFQTEKEKKEKELNRLLLMHEQRQSERLQISIHSLLEENLSAAVKNNALQQIIDQIIYHKSEHAIEIVLLQ